MKTDNVVQEKSYAFAVRIVKVYLAKLTISYKEARETHYWIRLLTDPGYINKDQSESLLADVTELLKTIGSIQKSIRNS